MIGQETTGPGGLAYAIRTVPVMMEVARLVAGTRAAGVPDELHQSRRHHHRGHAVGAGRPGARHLRHPVRAGSSGGQDARSGPHPGADGLRGAQPPGLDASGDVRRPGRAAPVAGRRRAAESDGGGQGLRHRLDPHPRRHPQRVPVLLLLPPGRGAEDQRLGRHPRRLPGPDPDRVLRHGAGGGRGCRRAVAGDGGRAQRQLHGRGEGRRTGCPGHRIASGSPIRPTRAMPVSPSG